jgi:hypothetical protein
MLLALLGCPPSMSSTMSTLLLVVSSGIVFAGAGAAYTTNSVVVSSRPRRGHCRHFLNSYSCLIDAGRQSWHLAAATSSDGLLTGIDVESAEYYSSDLVMKSTDDVRWLLEPGHLWEAATKDANEQNISTDVYLNCVYRALQEFQSSGEVHDREDFYQFLGQVYESSGNLLLVIGGKNIGKSLVLYDFADQLSSTTNFWPLLVDGRQFSGASLAVGILHYFREFFQRELFGTATSMEQQDTLNLMKSFVEVFSNTAVKDAAQALDALLLQALLPSRALAAQMFQLADGDKEKNSLALETLIHDSMYVSRTVSEDDGGVACSVSSIWRNLEENTQSFSLTKQT